jgi:hypothetical protein
MKERTPWFIAGGAVIAAVAVVLVVLLAGGGDSEDNGSGDANGGSQETFPPQVVRDSEIEAQESGSPERALLEWWQSFQFGDARAVIDRTSPATVNAIGEADLAELVRTRGQGLQGVEVLGSTEDGDAASVRAGLLQFQPESEGAPPPTTPTASRPITFAMVKQGDAWLFRETVYLRPMVEGLRKSRQEQRPQQGEGEGTETETTETETAPE